MGWTRALLDGKGALTLTVNGGREWASQGREGGGQTLYGGEIDWGMEINERLSAFVFALWEHNGYHDEVAKGEALDCTLRPELGIYELGGGLTYTFAPGWSLRPEVLDLRDEGNTPFSDDSSTEMWITVRKSF